MHKVYQASLSTSLYALSTMTLYVLSLLPPTSQYVLVTFYS